MAHQSHRSHSYCRPSSPRNYISALGNYQRKPRAPRCRWSSISRLEGSRHLRNKSLSRGRRVSGVGRLFFLSRRPNGRPYQAHHGSYSLWHCRCRGRRSPLLGGPRRLPGEPLDRVRQQSRYWRRSLSRLRSTDPAPCLSLAALEPIQYHRPPRKVLTPTPESATAPATPPRAPCCLSTPGPATASTVRKRSHHPRPRVRVVLSSLCSHHFRNRR